MCVCVCVCVYVRVCVCVCVCVLDMRCFNVCLGVFVRAPKAVLLLFPFNFQKHSLLLSKIVEVFQNR